MKKMYQKGSQQGMAHSTWVAVEGSSEHKDRATTEAMATEARGPRPKGWAAVVRGSACSWGSGCTWRTRPCLRWAGVDASLV